MKKIGMLVFIIMTMMIMMALVAVAQTDIRAGGLPAIAGIKSDCKFISAGPRAGGLPELIFDKKIKDCGCPPFCTKQSAPDSKSKQAAASKSTKATAALNVEFNTDKTIVNEKYYEDVKKLADFMKDNPGSTVIIEGHTDSVGNNAYNKKLSQKRANNVRQYIINKFGIDGKRIKASGFGEEVPIASNDTEEGRQKNRRVEAFVEVKK